MSCAWSRSARASTRASSAAAPTCAPPPRSGPSGSSARPRARPTSGGSRRVTGPHATDLLREHDRLLLQIAAELRARPRTHRRRPGACQQDRRRLEKALKEGGTTGGRRACADVEALAATAEEVAGAGCWPRRSTCPTPRRCSRPLDRVKGRLGDAAILLGTAADGRVHLLASVAPSLVERGVRAGAVVKAAAEVVGGGGGGATRWPRPADETRRSWVLRSTRPAR